MGAIQRGIRNVYRNKARTVVVIFILSLSLGVFIGMFQATSAVQQQTKILSSIIENTIEIRNAGATGMGFGAELIPESEIKKVEGIDNIANIEKQLLVRNVYSEYFPTISITVGNEPGKPIRVATHGEPAVVRILEGRNFVPEDARKNVAIVGQIYANNRGLKVGSKFIEKGTQAQAGIEGVNVTPRELEVIGIFTSGFSFGDNQVIIPYDVAQNIYGLEGKSTIIWLAVDSVENVDKVKNELKNAFGDKRDILTGEAKTRFVAQTFNQIATVGTIGYILSLIIGSLVVFFTMLLTTFERTKEIGVLKAVGASDKDVAKQFVVETFALAFISGILSLAVFGAIGPSVVNSLLGLNKYTGAQPGIEMGIASPAALLNVNYALSINTIILVFSVAFILGIIGSLYPVYRAVKMRPAEALRYE